MPTSQDPGFFAAQNDFSLLVARTAGKGRSLVVEELREAALVEKSAIDEALQAVFPSGPGDIAAAALRPVEQLRLANADEGRRLATPAAVQKFARESAEFSASQPGLFAVAPAKDGAGSPWVLAATATAAHAQILAALAELQLKPARTAAASLHTAHALSAVLKNRSTDTTVLCLDFGAMDSHALIVTRRGIEAAGSAAVSLDAIAEAVQGELGLKFKGSAGKLFFNELYDFSETGPKIAARLAPAVKAGLAGLGGTAPVELYCSGLPAKQQWLAGHLATELGLVTCSPDLRAWCASAGITFANPTVEVGLSPAWLGFLHFIYVQSGGAPGAVWSSEWISLDAVLAAPVAPPPPAPVVAPPAPKPAAAAPAPAPAPRPAATTPPAAKPAAPAPLPKPAPAPVKSVPAASIPPKPAPAPAPAKPAAATPKPTPAPAPAPQKPQPVAAKTPSSVTATPYAAKPAAVAPKKSKAGLFAAIAVVAVLGIGGFVFMQSKKAEDARVAKAAEEKALNDKRVKEEADKARLAAEQKARDDAEARKKYEAEVAQKLAAAETARAQAVLDAQAQTAARLANARGTVIIRTEPEGATVTMGTLPPKNSPATFSDVKIGRYPLAITLRSHDEVRMDVEVTENNTTEPPLVRLAKITGSIEVASDPAGANYEVRPANALIVPLDARRTGQTPATLNDLAPGDYSVTISRDGWPAHTENVTVGRSTNSKVSWAFLNGVVKISSTPEGATISRNGVRLGVTPLVLNDQTPGDVRYEANLAEHEPANVSGRVESGKTLSLSVPLLAFERIASLAELDKKPEIVPATQSQPEVTPEMVQKGGRVEIELTVTRTGLTKDLKIKTSSNPALDKPCLAAAAKLKFKPGSINGKAMNVRVVVPYVFAAQ